MSCATLTRTRLALLAAYLVVLFGISALDLGSPLTFVLVGSLMAVTIVSWRRTCATPVEGL